MTKKQKQQENEYDAQAIFEQAIESRTQIVVIERKFDKYFPYMSDWYYQGRRYQVYQILNAGTDCVRIGFMPVANA